VAHSREFNLFTALHLNKKLFQPSWALLYTLKYACIEMTMEPARGQPKKFIRLKFYAALIQLRF